MSAYAEADSNLRKEVAKAAKTLHLMDRHKEILGAEITNQIQGTVREVQRRLERKDLAVVVVGEKKAGKSTFLNAILGRRVLGTAVRECTGTVTFIRRAARPGYRAVLRDGRFEEFVDLESEERQRRASEIEAITQRLGDAPSRIHLGERSTKTAEVLEAAETRYLDANARVESLEADLRHWERQRQMASEDKCSLVKDQTLLEQTLGNLGDLRQASKGRLLDLESSQGLLRSQLQGQVKATGYLEPLAIPSQPDALAARLLAEAKVIQASASVPTLLRPAPWWAFWVPVLTLLFGWFFRESLGNLAIAKAEHKHAELLLSAAEAAEQIARETVVSMGAEGQWKEAKDRLDLLLSRIAEVDIRINTADTSLNRTNPRFAPAQRDADLALLDLHWAKADALEEAFLTRFQAEVHALTDMEKRGPEVVELSIDYPAVHLPDGITIIDTPGVNTDNESNRDLAWDVIRREADGCILISDLQQVVSRSTRDFLQDLRSIIPHILLVMSKVDRALSNAEDIGDIEPWQQVEDARRTGVRRFAKEVGRDPGEVFSIAVAAEPALRTDDVDVAARGRFSLEITKLFDLLKFERAIVLGARSATALRYCVQRIKEAEIRAELAYKERIANLEKHRLPNPAEFQARQLARIGDAIQAQSDAIAKLAVQQMENGVESIKRDWLSRIQAGTTKDQVKEIAAQLGQQGQHALGRVVQSVQSTVGQASGRAIKELETPLLEELSERYRIVQAMKGSGKTVQLEGVGTYMTTTHAVNIQAGVSKAVSDFETEQLAIGAGGAAAGAAIGTLILPGIGTIVGGLIGALAGFFKTLDSLKADCRKEVSKSLGDAKKNLAAQLSSVGPGVEKSLVKVLGKCLSDEVKRFQSWIDKVMEAERIEIEKERHMLSDLLQISGKLVEHDTSLTRLQHEAAAVSQGLCS